MNNRNNLVLVLSLLVFVLASCLAPVGIEPGGRGSSSSSSSYDFKGTPLPPIKTPAQWAIQIKRLNLLAQIRADKEAARAAGEQEAVPGASAAPAEEVVIPTEHTLVIGKDAVITLPSSGSGSGTNPLLNVPGFTIHLIGEEGGTPVLKLGSSGGTLLDIRGNQTIILENLKLEGVYPNNAPLVKVTGSSLKLEGGTEVTGNENTTGAGGGIALNGGSLLAGQGTKITRNTASGTNGKGGGIYALNNASLTIEGVIGGGLPGEGNNAGGDGGGIYLSGGAVIALEDGAEIVGNTAGNGGGGIYFNGGTHEIGAGVKISGNSASGGSGKGGGIYANNAVLKLKGVIGGTSQSEGNTATIQGGGIYLLGGSLTLEDGAAVSWNTTTTTAADFTNYIYGGGGVYADGTAVTMNGASAVSNNSVGTYSVGGGINLRNNKSLTMNESSVISDNNNIGVYLRNGGSLVMNGSSAISRHDNTGAYCHGSVKCTVTMNGNSVIGGFQQSDGNTFAGVGLYGGPHSLVMKDNAAIAWNRKTGSGGGGVYVQNSSSDTAKITMTGNAVIMNNTTTGELGGGMYIGGKTNVTLSGNAKIGGANGGNSCTGTGGGGGGIYFVYDSGSVLRIQDNAVISHNSTAGRGGGVWKGASSQVINLEIVPGSISGNFAGNTNYPNIYP